MSATLITQPDRITVEAHEVFRQSITPPAPQHFDEVDLAAADETPADRVLRLLDELQRKENPKP
jgi:hypothetical protein